MASKSTIQIIYRSGSSVTLTCDRFAVTRTGTNGQLKVEYTNPRPRPLLIGVDDIESVWELK